MKRRMAALVLGATALLGCEVTLLHDLSEAEANDLVTLLSADTVAARKRPDGADRYRVEVPRAAFERAWTLARGAGHPRETADPAPPGGLVVGPTAAASHARAQRERALANLLRATPGVLDAHVVLSPGGRVAAVVRLAAGDETPAEARRRLGALLETGAAGERVESVRIDVHRAPVPPPRPRAVTSPSPALAYVGAGILVALATVCGVLMLRLRRLRRSMESSGVG